MFCVVRIARKFDLRLVVHEEKNVKLHNAVIESCVLAEYIRFAPSIVASVQANCILMIKEHFKV